MLLPYTGDRQAEHFGLRGAPRTSDRYASDQSGTKTYKFNALGFRGETLAPDASLWIFVCGASCGLGTGLNWEETWGYRLKVRLAERVGLDPDSVNLLNFSQSFASAAYITRTLITQCSRVHPDLVVAHYSDSTRGECFVDGATIGAMPVKLTWLKRLWTLRPGWRERLARWTPGSRTRAEVWKRLRAWESYGRLFSAETGFINTLVNILLLQSYCRARAIECLISWSEHWKLSHPRFAENATIAPLIALLDRRRFLPFSLVDSGLKVDLAADGVHPGPRSSDRYAKRLIEAYRRLGTGRRSSASPVAYRLRTGT